MREAAITVVIMLGFALAFVAGWFLPSMQQRNIRVRIEGPIEVRIIKDTP